MYMGRGPVVRESFLARSGWAAVRTGKMSSGKRVVRGLPDQQPSLAWILTLDKDRELCCSDEVCDLRRAWA